jgi:hypothetical protein
MNEHINLSVLELLCSLEHIAQVVNQVAVQLLSEEEGSEGSLNFKYE